jgi:hypothetical protein
MLSRVHRKTFLSHTILFLLILLGVIIFIGLGSKVRVGDVDFLSLSPSLLIQFLYHTASGPLPTTHLSLNF